MGWGGVVWVGGEEEAVAGRGGTHFWERVRVSKCERMRKKAFKSVFLRFLAFFCTTNAM